jgi:protoporphyrinogen/coproporphyrinogen III oxidase
MELEKHIVVVGGGIAGLSAAYHLIEKSSADGTPVKVTVLEADPRWGGKILTERQGGFVIEGGPDTFLATKPWGVAMCRKLGIEGRLHGTNPKQKNTYVMRQGKLAPLPEGLMMMVPSRFGPMIRSGLLSWPQKARMGLDFFLPPRSLNGDESLGEFVSRRLGRAAYERLIEPLMSGIYAGDGDRLSLESTFPILRDMEHKHGGLIKGALALRKQRAKHAGPATGSRSMFLTPTTGLAEMVEAFVAHLESRGAELKDGTRVHSISRTSTGYRLLIEDGSIIDTDGVILAAPAFASGDMLVSLDTELASELSAIEYISTSTISMAFRLEDVPRPLDGYGYVIPRREGRKALACTWTSTKFPHRAPEGHALVRVFAGRAGQENIPWDEAGLLVLAREEVRLTLDITADPLLHRVYVWENAMPQYNLGHPQKLERIEACLERWPGLTVAGNGYRGIGIPDCIHSGEKAAEKILEQVRFPERVGR